MQDLTPGSGLAFGHTAAQACGYARSVSRRARVTAIVAVCASAAAGAAIGGALLQGDEGSAAPETARAAGGPPPLELDVYPGEPQARALRAAERAYDAGRLGDAAARFERVLLDVPASLEAAVGAAVAGWPDGTVDKLDSLAAKEPTSALVRLHLGLALTASGDVQAARREWRLAVMREPDTGWAVRADSLLHPDLAPGLPFFLPSAEPPERVRRLAPLVQLAALEMWAERGNADDYLVLGSVLQRLGRPVSARAAFDRAAELQPESLEARVAAAVGRFDKDDPSRAFSRLGPLSRDHPRSAVVRFHLGVMLLWIRAIDEAKRQLTAATETEPGSIWGRQADRILTSLLQR
jgi:tetratricopeptide (TPR) repeat protein